MVTNKKVVAGLTPDKGETKLQNGPALRYVGALPTSGEDPEKDYVGNYNFEEEYLLGDNKITIRWLDEENNYYRERIEYRQEDQTGEYYWIDYFETDVQPDDYDITYDKPNKKLIINLHNKKDNFTTSSQNYTIDSVSDLYYKDKDGNDIFISSKRIEKRVYNEIGYIREEISQI